MGVESTPVQLWMAGCNPKNVGEGKQLRLSLHKEDTVLFVPAVQILQGELHCTAVGRTRKCLSLLKSHLSHRLCRSVRLKALMLSFVRLGPLTNTQHVLPAIPYPTIELCASALNASACSLLCVGKSLLVL